MPTRRDVLAAAGALAGGMCRPAAASNWSASLVPKVPVRFEVPRGACDSHVHVIGDPRRYRMSPGRDYTPPPATATDLQRMLAVLHLDRVVIVAPTIYDTDNSATVDAVRQIGKDRARGVAIVDEEAPPASLHALAAAGIAGIRMFFGGDGKPNVRAITARLRRHFALATHYGWHLEISTPPEVIAAVGGFLATSPVPLVLHDFAWLGGGIGQDGFSTIASLMKSGQVYVKIAEPYRISHDRPTYADLTPLVRAFVTINPERVLWGSGWPHVDSSHVEGRKNTDIAPDLPDDAGNFLNVLRNWVPDEQTRRVILVDNPARLYRF